MHSEGEITKQEVKTKKFRVQNQPGCELGLLPWQPRMGGWWCWSDIRLVQSLHVTVLQNNAKETIVGKTTV